MLCVRIFFLRISEPNDLSSRLFYLLFLRNNRYVIATHTKTVSVLMAINIRCLLQIQIDISHICGPDLAVSFVLGKLDSCKSC